MLEIFSYYMEKNVKSFVLDLRKIFKILKNTKGYGKRSLTSLTSLTFL